MKEYEDIKNQRLDDNADLVQKGPEMETDLTKINEYQLDTQMNLIEEKKRQRKLSPVPVEEKKVTKKKLIRTEKLDNKRNAVNKRLPKKYNSEDLQRLLSRQDRMVVDLKELDKNKSRSRKTEAMRRQGDLNDTQAEIDEINRVLNMYANGELDATITDEDMDLQALRFKKARDLTQVLMNEHSKDDSKEMKNAKTDVFKLSITLENMKNVPATEESLGNILADYEVAIKSLEDYLSVKKKNTRYQKVFDVWQSLCYERDILTVFMQDPQDLEGTIGELMHMRKDDIFDVKRDNSEERIVNENAEKNAKKAAQNKNAKKDSKKKAQKSTISENAAFVQKVFAEENYNFSESFSKNNVKKKNKTATAAKNVALHNALREFRSGQTMVKDVDVLGKKVRLLQKADNTLYIIENHEQIPLAKSASLICGQIGLDMVSYSDIYGKESLLALMEDYKGNVADITAGEHLQMRSNLIEFLVKRTGLERKDFNNVRRTTMARYAEELIKEKKTPEQIKSQMAKSVSSEAMINGIELTELMELDANRQKLVNRNISMYEIRANQDEEKDWTPEEKAVRNLVADFIFAGDTLIMDKNADTPEEYVRTILLQNKKAISYLVNEEKSELIENVFKKLSLDQVADGEDSKLKDVMTNELSSLVTYLKEKVGTEGGAKEIEKRLDRILNDKDNAEFTKKMKTANEAMEQGIKSSCDILQKNVTEITDLMFEKTETDKRETLESIMRNTTRSDKGQGKFTKNVLNNYFSKMSPLDQRSMLASVLRSAHKAEKKVYSDKELFDEINQRGLTRYKDLLDERDLEKKPLNAAEKKLIDQYRQEKYKLSAGANYLGGLIRGAGPLFQKMMQGIPEDTLPVELRLALQDVKSNLQPIPERVVKSQLNAMVENSGGSITKIKVLKNLGAASVAQTFRCKIYGPTFPKEGKNVVIKLMRSDVQNRMKREEKVMLQCAKDTDEGMYETYKGQLSIYYKELDFKSEAENIKAGEVYNKKFETVESEKINGYINPTVNTLVLDEAEGTTLDAAMIEANKLRKEVRHNVCNKDSNGEDLEEGLTYTYERAPKLIKEKKRLVDKINEMIKKRDMIADLCNVWLSEALFRSGYYHADLHSGNILISDEKATLIDYGNAVKFSKDQQKAITQMMTAASSGHVETFFSAFNSMLDMKDQSFAGFYNEAKQREVKAEFEKILRMGKDDEAGQRISAALIKAQELGVKLPSSIYNFSQGQLRLQKSINDINGLIEDIKQDIKWIEGAYDNSNNADAVCHVQTLASKARREDNGADDEFKKYLDIYRTVDKEEFVNALLDNTYKEGNLAKGIQTIDKREEFDTKYLGTLANFKKNLLQDMYGVNELPDYKQFRKVWEEYKDRWCEKRDENGKIIQESKVGTKEQMQDAYEKCAMAAPPNVWAKGYKLFGGDSYLANGMMDAFVDMDEEQVEARLKVYEEYIPAGLELEKKVNELRELQDNKSLSKERKAILTDEIYALYNKIHEFGMKTNSIGESFRVAIGNLKQIDQIKEKDLGGMIREKTKAENVEGDKTLGEVFEEKLDEYIKEFKKHADPNTGRFPDGASPELKKKYITMQDELRDIHAKIAKIQLKRFYDGFYGTKPEIKSYDFSKVMKDVIKANMSSYIGNVGMGNLMSMAGINSVGDLFKAIKNAFDD